MRPIMDSSTTALRQDLVSQNHVLVGCACVEAGHSGARYSGMFGARDPMRLLVLLSIVRATVPTSLDLC